MMKKKHIYIRNGRKYVKLDRHEKIKEGAMQSWCNGELQPIANSDGKTIGDVPASFSDERDFYNPIGKTEKQMCLEMWEWLRDNPGKRKDDYKVFLLANGRYEEFEFCWACKSCDCECPDCPISSWGFPGSNVTCCNPGSPFSAWSCACALDKWEQPNAVKVWTRQGAVKVWTRQGFPNKALAYYGASKMVELIKNEWKE